MFKEYLNKIIRRIDLNESEMTEMIGEILSGSLTDSQIGAFMAALATKGETYEELAGAAQAMRRKAHRIQVAHTTVVDTVGTGGDHARTFNISTTTAFVVAGCGVTVAKHGNRSVSSQCGSADVLETLGVKLDTDPEIVEEAIAEIGIGFLFAPLYHSAMRFAAKPRKEVGIRSIFNMLGPLTNPAGANCQLIGVYAPELTEMFAEVLRILGSRKAYVVHGHDGLDEITICNATRVSELKDGLIRTYDIRPEQFSMKVADPVSIAGGNAEVNAQITRQVLTGAHGPQRNIVLLNAAATLLAADMVRDFKEGIHMAAEAIDSGAAAEKLTSLIRYTQDNG
jgi:anthranilate phosphoribosyltransferase